MTSAIPAWGLIGKSVFCLMVTSLLLVACDRAAQPDPFHLMEGEAIYKAECASCHGAQLQGSTDGANPVPPLDDSGSSWQLSETELMEIIGKGTASLNTQQPAHSFNEKLTARQMSNLLLYLGSHWSNRQQPK